MKAQNFKKTKKVKAAVSNRSLLIAIVLFLGLSILAVDTFARGSELNISLWNHSKFVIELDHQRYQSDCDFSMNGLNPGKHRVKIYTERRNHNHCGNGGMVSIHYDGFVDIPRNSKVIARVDRHRCLKIVDIIRYRPLGDNCGNSGYGNGGNHQCNSSCNHGHEQLAQCGNGGFATLDAGYSNGCMSNREFERLLCSINEAWFDSDKIRIAKQKIRHTHMSSNQVRRIMETFSFDNTKLKFAKFAYDFVVDPGNYYVVNDAFDFNSSIRELDRYLYG